MHGQRITLILNPGPNFDTCFLRVCDDSIKRRHAFETMIESEFLFFAMVGWNDWMQGVFLTIEITLSTETFLDDGEGLMPRCFYFFPIISAP